MVDSLKKPGAEELQPEIKSPAKETILTPRFYTTDFDEMAKMDISVNQEELEAILEEFAPTTTAITLSAARSLPSPGIILMVKPVSFSLNS
jgi:hypothetical protein